MDGDPPPSQREENVSELNALRSTARVALLPPGSRSSSSPSQPQQVPSRVQTPRYTHITTHAERILIRLRIWITTRAYGRLEGNSMVRYGPHTVVKFKHNTRIAEAKNMEHIAQNTTIPVPRVHHVFIIEQRTYIVMDYIDAPELTHIWLKLSMEERRGIFAQLKNYISQMRRLRPPHPGRIEAADGTGVTDHRLCLGNILGPFNSVAEFHTHLGHDSVLLIEHHRERWGDFAEMARRQYRTTFTHSDIAPRNILVKDGKIVSLIDWEMAGWYPEYWEYTRWVVSNFRSDTMWHVARDEIMDTYPLELTVEDCLDSVYIRT
ncbi:kinase-like domain-containing protein [Amylocystis lapponica]|nr:kinase-like domain-containing protein [Amylocystis lapponica]